MTGEPGPKSKKAASTICPTCGKEFWYYLSWPRKYCSKVCSGKGNVANIKHWQATGYDAACEQCGKSFRGYAGVRGRFCSLKCFGKWKSVHVVGPAHPAFGSKVGRHKYLPPPTMRTCPICGNAFAIKPSAAHRRRFCSKKCMAAWQAIAIRGEENFNWQGGYEPYYGPSWHAAKRAVRERDVVCQICGTTAEAVGRELDVHHIKPFRTFGVERHEDANGLTNLMLLCPTCHRKYEVATNR